MEKVGFIFLAAVPFFLLPTFAAFANKKASKFVFLGINVLMIAGLAVGIIPGVILWLILLHFSLRRDAPTDSALDRLLAYSAGKESALAELLMASRAVGA